ncbi:MAG: Na/Pi cotransporter family protein [Rhodospirillaceae bacterium]|nr:Na/Pi cotransporter family protein [Rhodospirillaceae bacterium]
MVLATLLGGIGLFLLGMWLMSDGLRLAAGDALRAILQNWISSGLQGVLAGFLITAIVQSSSAVTVATLGFVNAGLMTLAQAIWVIFGTNVGTTMTGWLVAAIGIKLDIGAVALPLIGIGMLLRLLAGRSVRRSGLGQALAGFGVFFLGINILQTGFADLAPLLTIEALAPTGWSGRLLFLGLGVLLTLLTQSSSAAIAITLTASAGGVVPLEFAAATVIGTNIGTTSTALFAAINATPPAKRVASAHIIFNLMTGTVALLLLPFLLPVATFLAGSAGRPADLPLVLAVFHTLFNCLGVAIIWPLTPALTRFLSHRFVSPLEILGRPRHLDATMVAVPSLALRGLVLELLRMTEMAFDAAARRVAAPTSPTGQEGDIAQGISTLGRAVRDFISKLSFGTLTDDVVAALPDLLRATQHLEEVSAIAAQMTGFAERIGQDLPELAELQRAVAGSLDRKLLSPATGGEAAPGADAQAVDPTAYLATQAAAVEAHYQASKAHLLRAAAMGRMTVAAMEAAQLEAQRLRRCADAALKVQRRLLPWLERAADPTSSNGAAGPTPSAGNAEPAKSDPS